MSCDITPYLTTSASPQRSSRSGKGLRAIAVSIQTPTGWWKAPIRFLARGWLTPTLPPTELSTWARQGRRHHDERKTAA